MTDIPPPFDVAWFRFILGFIIGAALGSFGTMLAYRLPRKISIVAPRSHCPSCGATLQPPDLIPLASWLITRGKCRHCHAKIGAQYLGIEIATSISCGIATAIIGISPFLILAYAIILFAVVGIQIKKAK
jgi:prepilin signal peptidase PulO-like enzyme (type II secretory pathway)